MIKLTIVTVCYNSEKYIERCIRSVYPTVEQMGGLVEYLIIDGNSKDNTLKIINNILGEKKYVRVISERDQGIYDAMNKGIRLANGEYILFLNSDDCLVPEGFNKMIDYINKNNEIECVYGDVEVIEFDNEGNEKKVKVWKGDPILSNLNYGMICSHQALICKKSVLEKFGGFYTRLKIAADWDLILRMYKAGIRFEYIDLCIAKFSRGGISSYKAHDRERHIVRKRNHCYRFFDLEYYKSIKTNIYNYFVRHKTVQ